MIQPIGISEAYGILSSIDLFICASSFESRCFSIPNALNVDIIGKSLVFFNSNEYQEINDNASLLKGILGSAKTDLVELNTNEPVKNSVKINSKLNEVFNTNEIIGNIVLDTTTFTHETLLALFRLLEFKRNMFQNLYIIYASAKEYSTDQESTELKWLSSGISEIRTIVGYPGVISPAKNDHLIVICGFETERTSKLVKELQVHEISFGVGAKERSVDSSFSEINITRHNSLKRRFENASTFEISLVDPFEAKRSLESEISKFPNRNIIIAAMNTKISTIATALVSIANPKIQLIYAKPIEYNVMNYSIPDDKFYFYKIY